MNDWVVETPSFEEDLMNNRVVMLNQNGVNRVVEIIKDKDKEIERLNNIIDKAIKCIDYNIKYRNGADIYQFVDIESEILEPLKFILELDEENGNAYLKEFNDWLKEVE